MKKILLTLFMSLLFMVQTMGVEPYSFELNLPIYLDDFEETSSNLVTLGVSSNTNLIPSVTITTSPTNSAWRHIRLLSVPNKSGNSQISITVCDNGYVASHTPLLPITPNLTVSTNADSTNWAMITLIGSNNAVHLQWYGFSNKFGYKINRYTTNNFSMDKQFTIGTTQNTNFVDANVVNGKTYWYSVVWIPWDIQSQPTNTMCTNLLFDVRIREPIALRPYFPSGVCFLSRSNAIYQVFTKTNASQIVWNLWKEINTPANKLIVLDDVGDKLLYVREKE